jgi:hypothetical protein
MFVLAAVIGSVIWVAVLGFFLALCRASGLADERAKQRARQRHDQTGGARVLDLGLWRAARVDRGYATDRDTPPTARTPLQRAQRG